MSRHRGFVRYDSMILVLLIGIGVPIALPAFLRLYGHDPGNKADWVSLIVGGLITLAGAGTLAWWKIRDWLEERRSKAPSRPP